MEKKIHYFILNESNSEWNDVRLESWLQTSLENGQCSFSLLEKIRLHQAIERHRFDCCKFEIETGLNLCMGSMSKTETDFLKEHTQNAFYNLHCTSRETYENARKEVMDVYNNRTFDFNLIKTTTHDND